MDAKRKREGEKNERASGGEEEVRVQSARLDEKGKRERERERERERDALAARGREKSRVNSGWRGKEMKIDGEVSDACEGECTGGRPFEGIKLRDLERHGDGDDLRPIFGIMSYFTVGNRRDRPCVRFTLDYN